MRALTITVTIAATTLLVACGGELIEIIHANGGGRNAIGRRDAARRHEHRRACRIGDARAGFAPVPQPTQPPAPAPTDTPPPPPPPPPAGGGTISISALNLMFDKSSLSATAGPVTITFNNQDTAVAHNIHFVSASKQDLGMTDIDSDHITETLSLGTLAPGTYYYKCDVHPTTMTGVLTVS